jgi:hypothetical protein
MINEKQLRTAAEEFNEVLGCTPPINVKGTAKEIIEKIKEAIELIDPAHDKFSKGTDAVIKAYSDKREEEPEEEPEEEVAEKEEKKKTAEKIHQKNIGSKKVIVVADEEEPEPEEEEPEEEVKPKKAEKAKAPKAKNTTGKTKKSIVEEMIGTKKGATIEEIAKRIVDEGIDPDYKKNLVVTKLWLSKMGFPTTKASIEKNPYFKKK